MLPLSPVCPQPLGILWVSLWHSSGTILVTKCLKRYPNTTPTVLDITWLGYPTGTWLYIYTVYIYNVFVYNICISIIRTVYICMYAYVYIDIKYWISITTYLHTYIHTYIHTYVHTYIHTYIYSVCVNIIYNMIYGTPPKKLPVYYFTDICIAYLKGIRFKLFLFTLNKHSGSRFERGGTT